jgi:hypothetical protein
MATSCHHRQALILHMDHNCLIVKNKRVGHPGTPTKCLLTGIPRSNAVVRSTSPVTSSALSSKNEG